MNRNIISDKKEKEEKHLCIMYIYIELTCQIYDKMTKYTPRIFIYTVQYHYGLVLKDDIYMFDCISV